MDSAFVSTHAWARAFDFLARESIVFLGELQELNWNMHRLLKTLSSSDMKILEALGRLRVDRKHNKGRTFHGHTNAVISTDSATQHPAVDELRQGYT